MSRPRLRSHGRTACIAAACILSASSSAQSFEVTELTTTPSIQRTPRRSTPQNLNLRWAYLEDAARGSIDRLNDVAVEPSRAAIVCGTSFDNTGDVAFVIKLDYFTGRVIWTVRLDETVADRAEALVIDDEGSVYVAGSSTPSPPFPDITLTKIDSEGRVLWTYRYDELDNNDEAVDVALGVDGSVVVTGHANGLQGANYFTAKLTRDGDLLWARQLDGGPDSVVDEPVAVAVDNLGGVLVTGTSKGSSTTFTPDVVTAKFSSSGDLLWTHRFDGAAQSHDIPWDMEVTQDGGCVVVGTTEAPSTGADPLVLRYAPDGTLSWSFVKGSKGGDSARAVVLDLSGNVYVSGSTFTGKGGFDVLAMKFKPDGRRAWSVRWDGGEGRGDAGQAIALNGFGRVMVAATSYLWATETDLSVIVLDAARGSVLATDYFNGPISRTDAPLAIEADFDGGFYVAGFANFPFEDFLVLRYDQWM